MKLWENIFVTYRVNIPILRASTNLKEKRENWAKDIKHALHKR